MNYWPQVSYISLLFDVTLCRYAKIYQTACTPSVDKDVNLTSDLVNQEIMQWEPTYDYGTDSVFSVAMPVVSKDSERVYENSVRVGTMGPLPVSQHSEKMYEEYAEEYKRMYADD